MSARRWWWVGVVGIWGCTASRGDAETPVDTAAVDTTVVASPAVGDVPWPLQIPDREDGVDCSGVRLVAWIDDIGVANDVISGLAPQGGRTTFSIPPNVLTYGPHAPCGYPDRAAAELDLPRFYGALLAADPAFADYPHDLVEVCTCTE